MKKILIIEDTSALLSELRDILIMEGYDVHVATNGYVGIAQVLVVKPDLLITDLMLPDLDGYEVISQIKSRPETSDIPIIVLSSKIESEDVEIALLLNADIYLKKPCSLDELLGSVKRLLLNT